MELTWSGAVRNTGTVGSFVILGQGWLTHRDLPQNSHAYYMSTMEGEAARASHTRVPVDTKTAGESVVQVFVLSKHQGSGCGGSDASMYGKCGGSDPDGTQL